MKVLLLNQDWFKEELTSLGHEVITAGLSFAPHLDHLIDLPMLHIDRVIESLPGGFKPDRILALDNSAPITVTGLDETDIPTVFFGVDAQHHANLHRHLHNVFDYSLTAQKDYLPHYEEWSQTVEWMPLWASRAMEPNYNDKRFGAVFVGTLDADLNPQRVQFFEELRKQVEVTCATGAYWDYFPHSEIVINQTVKLDLNFRVFEALMSGALLLTERSGNGLLELFNDGEHLVTYEKNNVSQAASIISHYLSNPGEARAIAAAGRERVLQLHTPAARADRISEILEVVTKKSSPLKYQSMAMNHLTLARSKRRHDEGFRMVAFTAAMKCFGNALTAREPIDATMAAYLWVAAHGYDRHTSGNGGYRLLKQFLELLPEHECLKLAVLRGAMNCGETSLASQLLEGLPFDSLPTAYQQCDQIFQTFVDTL